MKGRYLIAIVAVAALAIAGLGDARAQTYPSKPIRLIVPFAPGGSTDIIARAISSALGKQLGQAIVIDNKGGAGGAIGTVEMVRAAPDGYTLLMVTPSITAANPAINPNITYDPVSDFTTIINVAAAPTALAVHPSFPARDYASFVAELKRNPGRYSYASSGVGGILHLQMEVLKSLTGSNITHIPYRGSGPALLDVAAGQVAIAYDSTPSLLPYINDGRLIPIAVSGTKRIKELPDLPTFKEAGFDGMNRISHFGIVGPKGLPRYLVDQINAATRRALDEPAVGARIEGIGAAIVASTPEEFAADIKAEYEQLKKVVAEQKLTLE